MTLEIASFEMCYFSKQCPFPFHLLPSLKIRLIHRHDIPPCVIFLNLKDRKTKKESILGFGQMRKVFFHILVLKKGVYNLNVVINYLQSNERTLFSY